MSEEFYDKEIAPVLLELCRKCQDKGMPFVATVEYVDDCFGTTAALPEKRGLSIEWAYVAARSNGNADILIRHLIRQAEKRGHGSVFLKQLGVATSPPQPEKSE